MVVEVCAGHLAAVEGDIKLLFPRIIDVTIVHSTDLFLRLSEIQNVAVGPSECIEFCAITVFLRILIIPNVQVFAVHDLRGLLQKLE